jgi:hypothetical protein
VGRFVVEFGSGEFGVDGKNFARVLVVKNGFVGRIAAKVVKSSDVVR